MMLGQGLPTLGLVKDVDISSVKHGIDDTDGQPLHEDGIGKLQNIVIQSFGLVSACPECGDSIWSRPVLEPCGHIKCRKCFILTEIACGQCSEPANQSLKDKEYGNLCGVDDENADFEHAKILSSPNAPETDDEDEKQEIFIRSPKDILDEDEEENEENGDEYHEGMQGMIFIGQDEVLLEIERSKLLKEANENTTQKVDGDEKEVISGNDKPISNLNLGFQIPPESDNEHEGDNEIEGEKTDSDNDEETEKNDENLENPVSPCSPGKQEKRKRRKGLVTKHVIPIRSGKYSPKRYKCTICNVKVRSEYERKYHFYCDTANGKRPYNCQVCSKEFIGRSHYEYHMRSHTGERPFPCPICPQRFIQKVKLTRHMKSHNNGKRNKVTSLNFEQYMCAYCKKRFNTFANCKRHLRYHTDEKPFGCHICQKRFKVKYSLTCHLRLHSGEKVNQEKKHKCPAPDCDKSFSAAKDLKRHYLCHTGETPFHCVACDSKFRRKDNLRRHIRSGHPEFTEKTINTMVQEQADKYNQTRGTTVNAVTDDEAKVYDAVFDLMGKTKRNRRK